MADKATVCTSNTEAPNWTTRHLSTQQKQADFWPLLQQSQLKSRLSSEATRINDLGASIQSTLLPHRLGAPKGDQALQLANWPQVLLAKSFQYFFPTD